VKRQAVSVPGKAIVSMQANRDYYKLMLVPVEGFILLLSIDKA